MTYRTAYVHPTSGLHEDTYPGDISVPCYLVPCDEIDRQAAEIERLRAQLDENTKAYSALVVKHAAIDETRKIRDEIVPDLRDFKWLDPECHQGCQSLKFKADYQTLWRRVVQASGVGDAETQPLERAIQEVEHWAQERQQLKAEIEKMHRWHLEQSKTISSWSNRALKAESDLAAARRMNEVGVREYQAEKERFRERLDAARREVDETHSTASDLLREADSLMGRGGTMVDEWKKVWRTKLSTFLARQPAPPEPQVSPSLVEIAQEIERDSDLHRCHGCGGDGYYKGPRLGDTACPECNGTGRKPEPQGAMTGKALYEKWCELTSRKTRWDGTVFKGWEDGWDQLAELVAWKTPQAANALTGEQLRELYRRASGWSEFAAAVERHYRSVAVLAATPEEPRPESVNSAVDSRP